MKAAIEGLRKPDLLLRAGIYEAHSHGTARFLPRWATAEFWVINLIAPQIQKRIPISLAGVGDPEIRFGYRLSCS
jgi:hypothetical protein